jgi:hypothetical protein
VGCGLQRPFAHIAKQQQLLLVVVVVVVLLLLCAMCLQNKGPSS